MKSKYLGCKFISRVFIYSHYIIEIAGTTLAGLTSATGRFNNGTLEDKKQFLSALGSNPILTDGRLSLEEYFWLQPIKKDKRTLIDKLEKVRTSSGQIKNASEEAVYQHWCGVIGEVRKLYIEYVSAVSTV